MRLLSQSLIDIDAVQKPCFFLPTFFASSLAELLILLVHVGMAITILTVIINGAAGNPQLDDDGIDQLLDPWTKPASLISAASHAVWVALTVAFFASVQKRREPDRPAETEHQMYA